MEYSDDLDYCIDWLGAKLCALIAGVKSTAELREQHPHADRFAYVREILGVLNGASPDAKDLARAWFMGTQVIEYRHPFGNDVEGNPALMIRDGIDDANRRLLVARMGSFLYD